MHFIDQSTAAASTKTKIFEIIENNDFVGLRARHDEMINGKTSHEKFIKNYTSRINEIQDIATKCGIDDYSDLSEDLLITRTPEWSIDTFFEFQFPN